MCVRESTNVIKNKACQPGTNEQLHVHVSPLALLNRLHYSHLFPNIYALAFELLTLQKELSFSQLKRMQNYTLSTMTQERLQARAFPYFVSNLT